MSGGFPREVSKKGSYFMRRVFFFALPAYHDLFTSLMKAAHRDLRSECGSGMDTWIVSRHPIGVYQPPENAEVRFMTCCGWVHP